MVAPFDESEQLGSQNVASGLNVETDQPLVNEHTPENRSPARVPAKRDKTYRDSAAARHRSSSLHVGVALGDDLALVVGLAAPADPDLELGASVLEVEAERHDRLLFVIGLDLDLPPGVALGPSERSSAW